MLQVWEDMAPHVDRKGDFVTCYNCVEKFHISTNCQKSRKARYGGKVFSLSWTKTTTTTIRLIRGTCFINSIPLIVIIYTGATYSFISLDCAKRLELKLSSMVRSMVIDTLANGSVTTSFVCLKCPLTIYGKSFSMDSFCPQFSQFDVILGMNWCEFNCVHINYFAKTVMFLEMGEDGELMFISAKQVEEFLKEEA